MNLAAYKTAITYGLCFDIKSRVEQRLMLELITPIIDNCHMPDCHESAVRVGVFPFDNATEYRGLCERHKCYGMWEN